MRLGDIVVRKSYGKDIVFRIQDIGDKLAILKGVEYRLLADSPLDDLEVVSVPDNGDDVRGKVVQRQFELIKRPEDPYFEVPGTILHLDGDKMYLRKSMAVYNGLQIPAEGYHLDERDMAEALKLLLPRVQPDIVVITGHDGILKHGFDGDKQNIRNYKHSIHFVHAVRVARSYEKNRDMLTIVAGACQSHFEALLQEGANFASSPSRILIHALDPVYIAAKSAFTSVKDTVNIYDVISHTVSGLKGMGGIETRGNFRRGLPRIGSEN